MTSIDLASAGFLPAALVALTAGLLSFLSPCVLPIVPPYLAFMTGVGVNGLQKRERSAVVPAVMFVLGLSTVFLLLGLAASALGRTLLQYQLALSRVSGLVIIVLGLHFLRVIRIPALDREARIDAGRTTGGAAGAYLLGLAFAFCWSIPSSPPRSRRAAADAQTANYTRGQGPPSA